MGNILGSNNSSNQANSNLNNNAIIEQKNNGIYFWGPAVWVMLHFIAVMQEYNKKWTTAYYNIIFSLVYLIPCHECRDHLKQNLKQLPFNISVLSNKEYGVFNWTYYLHDIVNTIKKPPTKSPKYEVALNYYTTHKHLYTRSIWKVLHIFAACAENTSQWKKSFKIFIENILVLLPVSYASNYRNFIRDNSLHNILTNRHLSNTEFRDAIFIWTYNYHNYINTLIQKLNKPSFEQIKLNYYQKCNITQT